MIHELSIFIEVHAVSISRIWQIAQKQQKTTFWYQIWLDSDFETVQWTFLSTCEKSKQRELL